MPLNAPSPQSPPVDARPRRRAILLALFIVSVTLLVFGPVVWHEFLRWDDNRALTENPDFLPPRAELFSRIWLHPTHGYNGFYVPVTYTVWWVVARVAHSTAGEGAGVTLDPAAFHALNLLFHTGCAVAVFLILRRLVKSDVPAALGALLFALHPLQTEAVAWASSMYTSLSGLFALAALWLYLIFSDRDEGDGSRAAMSWLLFAAATVSFVLGLLTKPTIIVLPVIAFVIEVLLRRKSWRHCAPLLLWLLIGMADSIITRQNHDGEFALHPSLWLRPIVACDGIAFYAWKLAAPFKLVPDYGRSPRWLLAHPAVWVTGLVPVALIAAAWAVRRRLPWVTAGIVVFMIGPVATLGLVPFNFQVFSTVADRYAYLAVFGSAILLAFGVHASADRRRRGALAAAAALLVACGALTRAQVAYWHDTATLMARNLEVNPTSLAGEGVMGDLLFMVDTPEAHRQGFASYRAAVRDHPDDPVVRLALGRQLYIAGAYREAADLFAQSSRLAPRVAAPAYREGRALAQLHDTEAAIAAFRRALRINPDYEDARLRLGDLLADAGRATEAAESYKDILHDHPDAKVAQDRLRRLDARAGVDPR